MLCTLSAEKWEWSVSCLNGSGEELPYQESAYTPSQKENGDACDAILTENAPVKMTHVTYRQTANISHNSQLSSLCSLAAQGRGEWGWRKTTAWIWCQQTMDAHTSRRWRSLRTIPDLGSLSLLPSWPLGNHTHSSTPTAKAERRAVLNPDGYPLMNVTFSWYLHACMKMN